MSRTIWEWLGIEETKDKTLIRKAYAEQSKIYHPEERPEEAQKLREAYKRAMELSASEKKVLYFPGNAGNAGADPKERLYRTELPSRETGEEKGASGQEDKEGKYEYRFSSPEPGKEKESSGQEDKGGKYEYRFSSPESGKEKESSGQEDKEGKYEYRFSSPETEAKEEPPDRNKKEPSGRGGEQQLYQYDAIASDSDGNKGIHELAGQLRFLYENSDYRRVPRIWRFVFENYPRKDDLKDPRMIAELVSTIEQMPYLEKPVWKVLEKQIFRYGSKNADWMLLRDRFRAVRQGVDIQQVERINPGKPERPSSGLFLSASRDLYGKKSRMYKKYRFRVMAVAAASAAVSILGLVGALYWSSEAQEQRKKAKQQEMIDEWQQEIRIVQEVYQGESDQSRVDFQHSFTQEYPYEIDLNNDRMLDRVYYDFQQDCFVVALYDFDTEGYVLYGTMEQYLEEYPEMRIAGILPLLIWDGTTEISEE